MVGGGLGPLSRTYGLWSDTLTEVEVVISNGTAVTADRYRHPDLLFASRGGGGGSFGVVTSLTLKAFDLGNGGDVVLFEVRWGTCDVIPDVIGAVLTWMLTAPDELNVDVLVRFGAVEVTGEWFSGDVLPVRWALQVAAIWGPGVVF